MPDILTLLSGRGSTATAEAGATTTRATSTATALTTAAERGALATERGRVLGTVALAPTSLAPTASAAKSATGAVAASLAGTRRAITAIAAIAEAASAAIATSAIPIGARRGACLLLLVGERHAVLGKVEVLAEVRDAIRLEEPIVVLPRVLAAHKLAGGQRLHELEDGKVGHVLDLRVLTKLLVIGTDHDTICKINQFKPWPSVPVF